MKKNLHHLLGAMLLMLPLTTNAEQNENKEYEFDLYGFVRTDFYYNSRDCVAGVNDIFNLYPMDIVPDANGEDLNSYPSSGLFAFITRLGLNISGPNIGNATTTAKIEIDFGGYGSENTILRIRHAYMNLNWENGSNLIAGQTWHPLFGEVFPQMINVSTGAPFQPFSRTPQIKYSYKHSSGIKLTAAALWQLQYKSKGPIGSSLSYQADSCIPEFYGGLDYYSGGWMFGAGVNILNIQPRTSSTNSDGDVYKVNELMSATSAEAHLRYSKNKWYVAAKSIYASSLDHTTMLGGYGVTSIDPLTGEQTYAPMHNSTTWLNVRYGTKWVPSLFVGYTKNLGSNEEFEGDIYGNGTDIDQLLACNMGINYCKSHWSFGVEYGFQSAQYGDIDTFGCVVNTHGVTNHRVVSQISYYF